MKKIYQFLTIIGARLIMTSCYYDAYPEEPINDNGGNNGGVEISYKDQIVPLWVQCTGCHKTGGDEPNMKDNSYTNLLNGYVVPSDAEGSVLYNSLLGSSGVSLMPPGSKWPDSKINLVKDWINQGAKNN